MSEPDVPGNPPPSRRPGQWQPAGSWRQRERGGRSARWVYKQAAAAVSWQRGAARAVAVGGARWGRPLPWPARLSPAQVSSAAGSGGKYSRIGEKPAPACCGAGEGPGPALQPGGKRPGRHQAGAGQLGGACWAASAPTGVLSASPLACWPLPGCE